MHAQARLALLSGAAALIVMLVFAGLRSVVLVGVGLAGVSLTAVAAWLVLAHRGPVRWMAALLLVAAPVAVIVWFARVGLLRVVICSVLLWVLAAACGRAALVREGRSRMPELPAVPPRRPYIIMNPRSGGGKVGSFHLREKAEAMGADVLLLDPDHPQDVVALARRAVDEGADLLGVAGGDGTQALVAGVASERGVPFLVISAGTRNHFALDLGLDRRNPAACLDALADGVEVRVDLGRIGDRPFVNNASFGTYAEVVRNPAYRDDKIRTILALLPDLLARHTGPRLSVHAPGFAVDGPQAVLVSNNPYGRGDAAGLRRRSRLDTGTLGVLGVKVTNAAQAAGILRHGRAGGLTSVRVSEVVVDSDGPVIQVGVDGESLTMPAPVRCHVEPGALRVLVPRHRPGAGAGVPMNWPEVRRLAFTTGRGAGSGR
ncbi:diacylglycerol/lipid kinase family protein [Streptomyces sp. NPDC057939]|uniref:diacylglycerol/lipid kinase family protein n=1 Tax=Streptomyces sp. NPDC057939 TaxID=3346284 RepID=UPI0036E065DE